MNYGFVYETTNLINGKKYIGKHKRSQDPEDPDDSWYLGSGLLICRAISKYGEENFSRKILQECVNEEDLKETERYYITLYDATNSDEYYNITSDANPPIIQDYRLMHRGTEEKFVPPSMISEYTSLGWEIGHSPSYVNPMIGRSRLDMIGDKNPMRNPKTAKLNAKSREGYHHTEESLRRMREGQHKRFLEVGHGVRAGILHREETKEQISKTKKQQYASGELIHPMLGKSHKSESIQKMKYAAQHRKILRVCVSCNREYYAGSAKSKYCPTCREGR